MVPLGGLHLTALSNRLVTARSRSSASPDHVQRIQLDVEDQTLGRPPAHPLEGGVHHVAQVDGLRRGGDALVPGEMDQVADQAW